MTTARTGKAGRLGVLVVDDEPQILTAITDLLDEEFDVWTARGGSEALEVLGRVEVAVILTDQRMPGMTGAEFLGRARSLSDATRVLVTGYSDLDALVAAVNLGQIHGYLSKPWNPLELKVVVSTAADRWRLGRSLDQERLLLRSLMDNIPDAIFFKNQDLIFTHLNAPAASLLGLDSPEQAVGRRLGQLIEPALARDIEAGERLVLESGQPMTDQLREIAGADGRGLWISLTKAPIRQDDGAAGLVGVARDVTLRKEAEDFLREAHDRLQLAVDERTAWLQLEIKRRTEAEGRALAAREVAEAANRAKTIFLANMSHELRTPLNAILGFAELASSVMEAKDKERYGQFLDNISESAHHLLRVISDILDVSRVEVGKVVLRESDLSMEDVMVSVHRLIEHVISERKQELVRSAASSLPRIRGDARLIKQILLNLVSNAAKFSPDRASIRMSADLFEGQMRVIVEDDGIGIAAEDMALVLQPFGQAENQMTPKQEGAGLGLPLAKGFMELHGGTLSLDSQVGKGTRVTVLFPATRTLSPEP